MAPGTPSHASPALGQEKNQLEVIGLMGRWTNRWTGLLPWQKAALVLSLFVLLVAIGSAIR